VLPEWFRPHFRCRVTDGSWRQRRMRFGALILIRDGVQLHQRYEVLGRGGVARSCGGRRVGRRADDGRQSD
ncbi:hypothetical protein PENTCL1PPCAC_8922, partial [Pristionchus entomophagus]